MLDDPYCDPRQELNHRSLQMWEFPLPRWWVNWRSRYKKYAYQTHAVAYAKGVASDN